MPPTLHRDQISTYLFDQLEALAPWPPELRPVRAMVDGTAFFPGGAGLWQESSANSFPDIMVIGQDFSTADEHANMLAGHSRDLESKTWINFRSIASAVDLDLSRCFFTNAVMGVRAHGSSEGPNPGYHAGNADFMRRSHEFMSLQITALQPRLILVLGLRAAQVLSACSPMLKDWSVGAHKPIDACGRALVIGAKIGKVAATLVLLTHPSRWYGNVLLRRYAGFEGRDAEYALLRDALALLE
jgi:uracil-DNA glycosylase